ncbi:MAG TPA: HlyD family efflux transporter periplasmic adaptor subunit [Ohtaekwangia sp.]|uniref:HlyD family secretion protein n=1 Tax=Ohtaekwangia sp. TaxID=2066019 RepID=UPI002F936FAE
MPEKSEVNNFSERSEEVKEILSKIPGKILRWGSGSILFVICVFLLTGTIINYPDTVAGKVKLTTTVEPSFIYNLNEGYLEQIYIKENSIVSKGQIAAEIRSVMQIDNINFLNIVIADTKKLLNEEIQTLSFNDNDLVFGAVQDDYNNLKKQIYDYQQLHHQYFRESIIRLEAKIKTYKELSAVIKEKLMVGEEELKNARLQYEIDERLYTQQVIAKSDWLEKTSRYNQKKNDYQVLKESLLQNELVIKDIEGQIADLDYQYAEKREKLKNDISLSLKVIDNYKSEWKQNYTIICPIEGKLKFIRNISTGEFLKKEQPIALIIPQNQDIKAKAQVPVKGFGKVKVNQKVRITLEGFPYQEYGYFYGTILSISEAPLDDNYEVIIDLPDELITSYHHKIDYKPNLVGTAEIITRDYSLLERFFYSTRGALSGISEK